MGADQVELRHHQITVSQSSLHVVEAGDPSGPPVLFLHGWPESWRAWQAVIGLASQWMRAIAIDLPGVGDSTGAATDGSKRQLAGVVGQLADALDLHGLTLVGHDVGGMVAHASLRELPDLERVVIMDTVVPGVDPWDDVLRNPFVWHFAMHAIPHLPERLVQGRQRNYFDYFYNALSPDPAKITNEARTEYVHAYATDSALTAGFNWYRALPQDAADNGERAGEQLTVPVLYLRGEHEAGDISDYVAGFRKAGLANLRHGLVATAGHFAQEEAPQETWRLISEFIRTEPRPS